MDKVVDHLFVFKGNAEIKNFPGNYSEYRAQNPIEHEKVQQEPVKVETKSNNAEKELYKQLNVLEKKKENLNAKLAKENISIEELKKISAEIKEVTKEIESKTEEWLAASV